MFHGDRTCFHLLDRITISTKQQLAVFQKKYMNIKYHHYLCEFCALFDVSLFYRLKETKTSFKAVFHMSYVFVLVII